VGSFCECGRGRKTRARLLRAERIGTCGVRRLRLTLWRCILGEKGVKRKGKECVFLEFLHKELTTSGNY